MDWGVGFERRYEMIEWMGKNDFVKMFFLGENLNGSCRRNWYILSLGFKVWKGSY